MLTTACTFGGVAVRRVTAVAVISLSPHAVHTVAAIMPEANATMRAINFGRWRGPFLAEMEVWKRAIVWFGSDRSLPAEAVAPASGGEKASGAFEMFILTLVWRSPFLWLSPSGAFEIYIFNPSLEKPVFVAIPPKQYFIPVINPTLMATLWVHSDSGKVTTLLGTLSNLQRCYYTLHRLQLSVVFAYNWP